MSLEKYYRKCRRMKSREKKHFSWRLPLNIFRLMCMILLISDHNVHADYLEPVEMDLTVTVDETEVQPSEQDTETDEPYVPYDLRPETYIVPVIFLVIFVVGFLGNGILILIFLRKNYMRTVPNIYIFSLAVGDFIVIVGSVPFISTIYTFDSWPYGIEVCKLSEFLKDISSGVTVFTLMLLSVDRYFAIVKPLYKFSGVPAKTMTLCMALTAWIVSAVLATPGAYYSFLLKMELHSNESVSICYPFPPSMEPWYSRTVVMTKFLLLYAIPLVVITYFYVRMARHLVAATDNAVGVNQSHQRKVDSRTKVAKVVLAFVITFAGCFFPNHIFLLWFYFSENSKEEYSYFWHTWKIFGYIMTFVNSCLNPVSLYFISSQFRYEYRHYYRCCSEHADENGQASTRTLPNTSTKSTTRTILGSRV